MGGAGTDGRTAPLGRPAWAIRTGDPSLEVYGLQVTLAFLTGIELDPAVVLTEDLERLRAGALDGAAVPFVVSVRQELANREFYAIVDSDHGTEVLPSSVARVDPSWLVEVLDGEHPAGWRLAGAQLELHDFGVGSVQLHWVPTGDRSEVTGDELVAQIAVLHDRSSALAAPAVATTVEAYVGAVGHLRLQFTDDPTLGVANDRLVPDVGRVLWASSHCQARTAGDHTNGARSLADIVCPNDYEVLSHRDHTYAAATSCSVTCSSEDAVEDAVVLARVMSNQDAWWTLYWSLDRRLLALQMDINAASTDLGLRALDRRASAIAEVHSRMALYASRIDSMLASSGARDLAVWDTLASAWSLPYRRACVDRKLEQLQRAYASALAKIDQARGARINIMVFVFTAFGVVASAISVAQFVEAKPNESLAIRLAVLAFCTAIAIGAVGASLRSSGRKAIERTTDRNDPRPLGSRPRS